MLFDGVELSLPPGFFFNTPPSDDPLTLLPPSHEQNIRSPLAVDPQLYHWTYSARFPITFSITYFALVTICNAINRRRGNKPTAISNWWIFKNFVLLHNLALAVYSGVTCVALWRAIYASVPGFFGPNGLPGTVDGLCKMHGPRGFGDAVVYDPTALKWKAMSNTIHLGPGGLLPDTTDVGRIWNEGLAFWGWLFYLSKYYEVVDTIIILLKGKRATTLQKYHHAGALLCMWAGMRYMSPPIWMFVAVNSGIHALMYTFYTASTLGIRVPGAIKQTITTLQILQFLVGASFAGAHLFVSYSVPVSVPAQVLSAASAAVQVAPKVAADALSAARSSSYQHNVPPWLKRLLYRAAGAEGLAETVTDESTYAIPDQLTPQTPLTSPTEEFSKARVRHETVRCLDTEGEAFAVWLNVLYLTPLTLLFLRFFWKSYLRASRTKSKKQKVEEPTPRRLSVSAIDAARQTSASFEEYGTEFEKSMGFGEHEATNGEEATVISQIVVTVEKIDEEVTSKIDEAPQTSSAEAAEIIAEIAEEVKRPASQASNKSRPSTANGSARTPSRTKNGLPFSEQAWFGSRDSPSLRSKPLVGLEQDGTMSTSVSTSLQSGSWTDTKTEEERATDSVLVEDDSEHIVVMEEESSSQINGERLHEDRARRDEAADID